MKAGLTVGGVVCLPGKTIDFVVCEAFHTVLRLMILIKENVEISALFVPNWRVSLPDSVKNMQEGAFFARMPPVYPPAALPTHGNRQRIIGLPRKRRAAGL
ncbi:hypothetical protein [Pseudoduganella namucuonensis]|uniref:hypothetical protein n=1 Tax=Pseudoduganella namucuonensis TaxID=1035707 RepID=UPI001160357E|nr:hypothetical protein [Pseudoduganella namucuonensis]